MPSLANKVTKNTGLLYLRLAITVFVSLYTTRIVLGCLGIADYGIYTLVGGSIAFLGFFNSSLTSSTQRYMSYAEGKGDEEIKKKIFNISVVLHFILSILLAIIFILAGFFFFSGFLKIPEGRTNAAIVVYACLLFSTLFSVMSVPYVSVLNAHENFSYYAVVGVIESFFKLAVAYVCLYVNGDKLMVYGLLMSIIPLCLIVVMRIYCKRHYEECIFSPTLLFEKQIAKGMASFAGWNLLSSFSSITMMQGIAILLNYYGGVVVNTAHGIANQLSGQTMAFSSTLIKALNPALVKSFGEGKTDLMLSAAETGNKLSYACFAIFAIPIIVEMPTILSLWLGKVPEWAVLFCRLVLVRQMITQTFITFDTCIKATGQIKSMTIISSILWLTPMFVGIVMYQMGAPVYTIYVLLIILSLFRVINSLYFCSKLCHLDSMSYIKKSFIPMIVLGLLMASFSGIHLIWAPSLFRCFFILFFSIAVFPILFYKIVLNKKEKQQLLKVLCIIVEKIGNRIRK